MFLLEFGGSRDISYSKCEKLAGATYGDKAKNKGGFRNSLCFQNSAVPPQM